MLHLPNKHVTFSLKLSYRTATLQLAALQTPDSGLSIRRTSFRVGGAIPLCITAWVQTAFVICTVPVVGYGSSVLVMGYGFLVLAMGYGLLVLAMGYGLLVLVMGYGLLVLAMGLLVVSSRQ